MGGAMRSTIPLALLVAALFVTTTGKLTAAAGRTNFIRVSCRSTLYPAVCVECLSAYRPAVRRSPLQLAHAALSVSADRARNASSMVSRMSTGPTTARSKEGGPVRDCLATLRDSVDRLGQSVRELRQMGRAGSRRYAWHLSNVETWVSAALTDQNTCLDGLPLGGGASARRLRAAAIRKKIVDVAQVTSNALALVNRLGPKN